MRRIFELERHVADLIAAGEVVERPASVVKELIENSIDAGAGVVTAEISAGGMTFIRVTDNGCGIAPEDAKTAFLRHATSKLRGPEGLEAIGTLGFRGEALAAIAAVSRIELLTRERGASEGVSLSLEAGTVIDMSPAGCPEGTTIIVRDLFFNTPARHKFMKSDRAEASAVAAAVLRSALSRIDVSVRFIKDGKSEYHTLGDSRAESCIYSMFGREFFAGLTSVKAEDQAVAAEGYVSTPSAARGNRSYQFFIINGRPVKSITLQSALERAYENILPSGRYPSCVLYIKTGYGDVDVNVHPAKTEVKFASEKQIFDCVYYAALGAISGNAVRRPELGGAEERKSGSFEIKSGAGFKTMQADDFRKTYGFGAGSRSDNLSGSAVAETKAERIPNPELRDMGAGSYTARIPKSEPGTSSDLHMFNDMIKESHGVRVIGEAMKTYIIAEHQGSVWFIDKHAAHERIHFDALKSSGFETMSQALITPVICRHGAEDASLLLENTELLDRLGFDVESFGEDAVAVRYIPAEIEISDAEPVLSEICDELRRGGAAQPARQDNIFRVIACKAAIKAGKSSAMRELETLAAKVMSGEVSHCPHGRPVIFEVSKATLDRGFKRI